MVLRRWQGGPLLGQKLGDCSSLIRLVSAAFPRPGFPHLSSYLSVCQAYPSWVRTAQNTLTKFLLCFWIRPGICPLLFENAYTGGRQTCTQTDVQTATVTAVTYKDGGEACREMRECVNPHAVAFPLWICVRLNFSRVGRQGAIGHSVNVSGSEQPEPRQPYAVACHSLCLCLCAVYFLLSPHFPHLPYPALFHTFIIVFYLCLTIACRKIAHPVIDKAGFSLCVSLFLSPFLRISVGPKSTSSLSVSRYSVS